MLGSVAGGDSLLPVKRLGESKLMKIFGTTLIFCLTISTTISIAKNTDVAETYKILEIDIYKKIAFL